MNIEETLKERGQSYGSFITGAIMSQQLKGVCKTYTLPPLQAEALDMIFSKISRLVNGDIEHRDSWHDIAGYASLVVNALPEKTQSN